MPTRPTKRSVAKPLSAKRSAVKKRPKKRVAKGAKKSVKKKVATRAAKASKPSSKSGDALARLRQICLAFPEAHEVEAWGEPTFRVRNKRFATHASSGNHHGSGRPGV